ncbi:hypothetical protein MPH_08669, partial [Macrophomina phaseolina MS6]
LGYSIFSVGGEGVINGSEPQTAAFGYECAVARRCLETFVGGQLANWLRAYGNQVKKRTGIPLQMIETLGGFSLLPAFQDLKIVGWQSVHELHYGSSHYSKKRETYSSGLVDLMDIWRLFPR